MTEADNIEGRNLETINQGKASGEIEKKEMPDDPSFRKFFDKDPSTATIRSSNADRTFGNEYPRDE